MNAIANIFRSKSDPKIVQTGPSSMSDADQMARALGWFSIALGAIELFGAGKLARGFGMRDGQGLIRAFGVREIATGVMTLSTEKEAGLWSRVAGDTLDLVALRPDADATPEQRGNVKLALAAVAGITVLDILAARAVSAERRRTDRNTKDRYADRSGFPKGLSAARTAATATSQLPAARREAILG